MPATWSPYHGTGQGHPRHAGKQKPATTQASGRMPGALANPTRLPIPSCWAFTHHTTLQHRRLPNVTTTVTKIVLWPEQLRTSETNQLNSQEICAECPGPPRWTRALGGMYQNAWPGMLPYQGLEGEGIRWRNRLRRTGGWFTLGKVDVFYRDVIENGVQRNDG